MYLFTRWLKWYETFQQVRLKENVNLLRIHVLKEISIDTKAEIKVIKMYIGLW